MPDDIQTMTVTPDSKTDGKGDPIPKGGKLSRAEVTGLITQEMPGLSKAGIEGVVRNVMRESGGDPRVVGDHGSSGGLFQHHNSRWDSLKGFAKAEGMDWQDPRAQVRFSAQEMKKNYPTLLAQLQKADDPAEAEDGFKRVFERPASIMWANKPTTATSGHSYSPYALGEHQGRKDTDLVYMRPRDYLDLAPDFEQEPWSSPSGKSLKNSVSRGDDIEAVPTLDMKVNGQTGRVTDQDGRHRALLAEEEGVDAIPVAIRQQGKGTPTEIQGLSGNVLPNDFPKAKDGPKDASVWKRALDAIVPSAEAAERGGVPEGLTPVEGNPFAKTQAAPQPGLTPVEGNPFGNQQPEHDGMVMSAINGAGAGFGKMVLGGQELLGKGLDAVGAKAPGDWLVNDARKGIAKLNKEEAPDKKAHPWATGAGEFVGESALPGGAAGKIGGNALRVAATGGGLAGLLAPVGNDQNYWGDKAKQVGVGAAEGAATGVAGDAIGSGLRRAAVPLKDAVQRLMGEGVELTHGQMVGGPVKWTEDKLMSMPLMGDAIKMARKRGFETFNRAAINRALSEVGTQLPRGVNAGHDAIEVAQDALSQAYDRALVGTRVWADTTFQADMQNLRSLVGEMPPTHVTQFDNIVRNRVAQRLGPQGNMDGQTFKQVESELTKLANGFRRSRDMADQQLGTALREVNNSLREALERGNPGKRAEIGAANRGYAMLSRVEDASMRRAGEGDGVFTPNDLWQTIKRDAMQTGRRKAFARGDAMMQDLATAGQQVLPSSVPNSGSFDRFALGTLLTGGAASWMHHPEALLGLLGGAAAYAKPTSKAANWAMNRLAQPAGPTRNALAALSQRGGSMLAPGVGAVAAGNIPTMTVRPGDRQ